MYQAMILYFRYLGRSGHEVIPVFNNFYRRIAMSIKSCLLLSVFLILSLAVSADYVDFIGQLNTETGERMPGVGSIDEADNWAGGVVPYGSDIGRITNAVNVWSSGIMQNAAVRLEGGTITAPSGVALRGGASGSGVTTLLELDTNDWDTVTNLLVPEGQALTFWSQYGEKMVLNVLNGSVETPDFNSPASGKGTLNMGNGIFHAGQASGTANYNMLAGGSGDIIFDVITPGGFGVVVNFETGNMGSFTFGSRLINDEYSTTAGVWEYYINAGKISIDGVVTTDKNDFIIIQDGLASTIVLKPEVSDFSWIGGVGDWNDGSNWDVGVVPFNAVSALIYDDGSHPSIYSPLSAAAGQVLMGLGNASLTIEAGASLSTPTFQSGYKSGNSTVNIEGSLNCPNMFQLGYLSDELTGETGNSVININDPDAELTTFNIKFGDYVMNSETGLWDNVAGTGVLFINDGTVSASQITGFVPGSVERIGIDISSDANGALSLASGQPVSWWQSQGYIFADGGSGVIQTDNVGDRIIVTARAYDPEIDGKHAYNMAWDAGGETQSFQENWNYESNELPWPGDVFVTTGKASMGQHPIIDTDAQLGAVTIGWQPIGTTANDYIEIAQGVTLDIIGTPDPENPESQGQGQGDLNLGANGITPEAPGKGTLIMNGVAFYANEVLVGAGNYDNYLYGDGHVEMNSGIIECNTLRMSLLDDPGYPPLSYGSIDMNGGSIVVNEEGGLTGLADCNGIVMSGNSSIIVMGDITADVAAAITAGKITGEGADVMYDYDVTNAGKTTVYTQGVNGDINGDGKVDIDDVKTMAANWLTGVSTGGSCDGLVGDLNGDCDVNYEDFVQLASYWIN
jgi:hypothetical protein